MKVRSKTDVFKLLDRRLTDEEKRAIASADDMTNWHFSLGLWIRNNWIYKGKYVEFFCEETTDGLLRTSSPDVLSNQILEEYQRYLLKCFP